MTARYLVSDVFDGLATLEDGSVDLVVTSPPFLALRSYLPADHPDKAREIGSEATPAAFLDVMLAFTAELRRVLAPHGSICIELGDTYASGGGVTDGRETSNGGYDFAPRGHRGGGSGWPLAKSKTLIPELYRIALAYGINPLTGQPSPAGQWRVRNVVTWARPNPPVGALGDKWRPATSDVVVACVSGKRYWDDLATRKPYSPHSLALDGSGHRGNLTSSDGTKDNTTPMGVSLPYKLTHSGAPLLDYWEIPLDPDEEPTRYGPKEPKPKGQSRHREGAEARTDLPSQQRDGNWRSLPQTNDDENSQGAPLLDYWEIPLLDGEEPKPYGPKEKPPKVNNDKRMYTDPESRNDGGEGVERYTSQHEGGCPLLDYWVIPPGGYEGSHYAVFPPELVVPLVKAMTPEKVCRVCGEPSRRNVGEASYVKNGEVVPRNEWSSGIGDGMGAHSHKPDGATTRIDTTEGWTDCGHNNWRPGLILDPFAGSGTTLLVATGHGHDAIGIDLDARNAELALERVGPFLLEVV